MRLATTRSLWLSPREARLRQPQTDARFTAVAVVDAWAMPDGRVYAVYLGGVVVEVVGGDGVEVAVLRSRSIFARVGGRWLIDVDDESVVTRLWSADMAA